MNQLRSQQAVALAEAGQGEAALQLLREGQAIGEAACYVAEGLWQIEGRVVPRDLAAARQALARAAELGNLHAARMVSGMLACGAGGRTDWPGAVAMLEEWRLRDPIAAAQLQLIQNMEIDEAGQPTEDYALVIVRDDPRIATLERLLSVEECNLLIRLAEPRLKRAMIFHEGARKYVEDDVRRSGTAGFPMVFEWPFVRAINNRIAKATGTLVEVGEPLQILRYEPSQEYRPHHDALADMDNPRILTALVWLNEQYTGGETSFPELQMEERGRTGDLIVFANTLPDGSPDPRMWHAGKPVIEGVKFLASRWIRANPSDSEGFGPHEFKPAAA